jgi:hypothetical protein
MVFTSASSSPIKKHYIGNDTIVDTDWVLIFTIPALRRIDCAGGGDQSGARNNILQGNRMLFEMRNSVRSSLQAVEKVFSLPQNKSSRGEDSAAASDGGN